MQVHDLARAQGVFLREALLTGTVIHQTDPRVRGELISRMLDFTEDWPPVVRKIRRRNRERFLSGGSDGRTCGRRRRCGKARVPRALYLAHRLAYPASADELFFDYERQDINAVNLQRAFQICVELGGHRISERGWQAPSAMAETITTLAEHDVIDAELASRLRRAVGFPNISVHEYNSIDWRRVYRLVTDHLQDVRRFAAALAAAEGGGADGRKAPSNFYIPV